MSTQGIKGVLEESDKILETLKKAGYETITGRQALALIIIGLSVMDKEKQRENACEVAMSILRLRI